MRAALTPRIQIILPYSQVLLGCGSDLITTPRRRRSFSPLVSRDAMPCVEVKVAEVITGFHATG